MIHTLTRPCDGSKAKCRGREVCCLPSGDEVLTRALVVTEYPSLRVLFEYSHFNDYHSSVHPNIHRSARIFLQTQAETCVKYLCSHVVKATHQKTAQSLRVNYAFTPSGRRKDSIPHKHTTTPNSGKWARCVRSSIKSITVILHA